MEKSKKWLYLLVDAAIGCIIFAACAAFWGLFDETEPMSILKLLADSATVPGVLLTGIATLSWIGKKGTFDLFGYSWFSFTGMFKRESYNKRPESLYDYRVRRDANRKPYRVTLLFVGLGFLAVAILLTVIFLIAEPAAGA